MIGKVERMIKVQSDTRFRVSNTTLEKNLLHFPYKQQQVNKMDYSSLVQYLHSSHAVAPSSTWFVAGGFVFFQRSLTLASCVWLDGVPVAVVILERGGLGPPDG